MADTAGRPRILPGNVSIAYGSYIEDANGTNEADVIIGNLLSNRLSGGSSDDWLYGEGYAFSTFIPPGDGEYHQISTLASQTYREDAPAAINAFVTTPTKSSLRR